MSRNGNGQGAQAGSSLAWRNGEQAIGGEGFECQAKNVGLSLVKGHRWHQFIF